jgi:hypothetical protein
MATHKHTRPHRTRKSAPRRLVAAFAEHWLLALAAHVTATIVLVVLAHATRVPSCG